MVGERGPGLRERRACTCQADESGRAQDGLAGLQSQHWVCGSVGGRHWLAAFGELMAACLAGASALEALVLRRSLTHFLLWACTFSDSFPAVQSPNRAWTPIKHPLRSIHLLSTAALRRMEAERLPKSPLDPSTLNKNQKKKRRKALSKYYRALAQVGAGGHAWLSNPGDAAPLLSRRGQQP